MHPIPRTTTSAASAAELADYRRAGYPVLECSATDNSGLDALGKAACPGGAERGLGQAGEAAEGVGDFLVLEQFGEFARNLETGNAGAFLLAGPLITGAGQGFFEPEQRRQAADLVDLGHDGFLDGGNHRRMAVPAGADGDAGGESKES